MHRFTWCNFFFSIVNDKGLDIRQYEIKIFNRALGLGATRGRIYIKHPDIFKVRFVFFKYSYSVPILLQSDKMYKKDHKCAKWICVPGIPMHLCED